MRLHFVEQQVDGRERDGKDRDTVCATAPLFESSRRRPPFTPAGDGSTRDPVARLTTGTPAPDNR
jgi:hypothetical protein